MNFAADSLPMGSFVVDSLPQPLGAAQTGLGNERLGAFSMLFMIF